MLRVHASSAAAPDARLQVAASSAAAGAAGSSTAATAAATSSRTSGEPKVLERMGDRSAPWRDGDFDAGACAAPGIELWSGRCPGRFIGAEGLTPWSGPPGDLGEGVVSGGAELHMKRILNFSLTPRQP